jgi:histone H3/H4
LIAVQRLENGEQLPHPCFCATRVGFWHEIGGDWYKDAGKQNRSRRRDEPDSGHLLSLLQDRQADWYPLRRSNRHDLHPLFFGVYGDLVYHHGGGFRPSAGGPTAISQAVEKGIERNPVARAIDALPRSRLRRVLRRRFHPANRIKRELRREMQTMSEEMFERLESDPHFYRELLGGEEPQPHAPPTAAASGVLQRDGGAGPG